MEQQRFCKQVGIITRACSHCGGDLGNRYGSQRYCNTCHAEYMRINRRKYIDLEPEAKSKATARSYANVYVKRGGLKPQTCEVCGEKAEKHHDDYSKPLEVRWLCRKHHLGLHRQSV